ncbi:MAG TPA: glycosyltransferase [Noviherbaspirillum sp.]|uniref:glycosyltransferase n=1 Tax=Noviherbaspirillum sp. TaxID=1926288 RepID=UPI002D2944DC|nr:glycosyltransferase [Noviherbaspirillum sp.]HYD97545.1 glycosyltransferase [Noviherbaspirillum sp.]
MNMLFAHQSFPGQYLHLAPALARRGHTVIALTVASTGSSVPGVKIVRYRTGGASAPAAGRQTPEFDTEVLLGERAAHTALRLRSRGFSPDVICVHPGWSEALFLKDVWPRARLLSYCEFYQRQHGAELHFDREFGTAGVEQQTRQRTRNACNLLSLEAADWGVSPTHWQRSLFPQSSRARISVIHDGIDTELAHPDPHARFRVEQGNLELACGDEVVTFASRDLKPERGFHVFMRALPELLELRPAARVLVAGRDNGCATSRASWKKILLDELDGKLDMSRVHFVGELSHSDLLRLLQVSAAHVYLTYPLALSWSLLEAMSSGCLVVASRTPPVEEVVERGQNGLLVDFFNSSALARTVASVLADPRAYAALRKNARSHIIANYDLRTVCLPRHIEMVESLASKDMIISSGYNVYPEEIECIIDEIDGVVESAVVGVPHPDGGEAVTAVIVPKPGVHLSEQEVVTALKPKVANFMVPRHIFFVPELPRDTAGAVQKNLLRARYTGA